MTAEENKIDIEKFFKRIILLDVLIEVSLPLFGGMITQYVSPEEVTMETIFGNDMLDLFLVILILMILIFHFISLYLLYKFKSIGRKIYVLTSVLFYGLIFVIPLQDILITDRFEYILESTTSILTGVILTMIYLTDIRKKFKN